MRAAGGSEPRKGQAGFVPEKGRIGLSRLTGRGPSPIRRKFDSFPTVKLGKRSPGVSSAIDPAIVRISDYEWERLLTPVTQTDSRAAESELRTGRDLSGLHARTIRRNRLAKVWPWA